MMKIKGWGLLVVASVAFGAGAPSMASPVSEKAAAAVIDAERAFAARHKMVPVKEAFLEYSAGDGVALTPGGVKNVKEFLGASPSRPNAGFIEWGPTFAGMAQSGDLGFTTGPASYGGGKAYSNYFTVWKKQADGSWRWMIDLGTPPSPQKPVAWIDSPVEVVPVSKVKPMAADKAWTDLLRVDTELGQAMAKDVTALTARLAPEARLIGFEPGTANGTQAARASLAKRPAAFAMKPEGGGVSKAGDFGWTYGYANWMQDGQEKKGPYLRVWQRRTAGWVVLVENVHAF